MLYLRFATRFEGADTSISCWWIGRNDDWHTITMNMRYCIIYIEKMQRCLWKISYKCIDSEIDIVFYDINTGFMMKNGYTQHITFSYEKTLLYTPHDDALDYRIIYGLPLESHRTISPSYHTTGVSGRDTLTRDVRYLIWSGDTHRSGHRIFYGEKMVADYLCRWSILFR